MKLTICIPSYNRPIELDRAIGSVIDYDVNVLVSDDKSPKYKELETILLKYTNRSNFEYILSDKNNGYDRNLLNLVQNVNTEYTMFLSDDDIVLGNSIRPLLDFLDQVSPDLVISPFHQNGHIFRKLNSVTTFYEPGIKTLKNHFSDSVLFSGLVYKTLSLKKFDYTNAIGTNYIQLLFSSFVILDSGFYYFNHPTICAISDGENGFWKEKKFDIKLSDRNNPETDIEFHKGMFKLVQVLNVDRNISLSRSFKRKYSFNSFSILYRARMLGLNRMIHVYKLLPNKRLNFIYILYLTVLTLTPPGIVNFILQVRRKYFNPLIRVFHD